MNISDMIAELQKLKDEHGDLPCMQWSSMLGEFRAFREDLIYFDRACDNCDIPQDAIYFDIA